MDKTLQIVELMLTEMENNPGRYKVEVTSQGVCIIDYENLVNKKRELPDYYTFFYKPEETYEHECNKMFNEFIGGLKA